MLLVIGWEHPSDNHLGLATRQTSESRVSHGWSL